MPAVGFANATSITSCRKRRHTHAGHHPQRSGRQSRTRRPIGLSKPCRAPIARTCSPPAQLVDLVLGDILYEPGMPLRAAHFPLGGFISLLSAMDGHERLQLGLISDEGMQGASLVLSVTQSDQCALVHGAGPDLRIGAQSLRREMQHSRALRRAFRRYLHVSMAQHAQAAVCIRFHLIEQPHAGY